MWLLEKKLLSTKLFHPTSEMIYSRFQNKILWKIVKTNSCEGKYVTKNKFCQVLKKNNIKIKISTFIKKYISKYLHKNVHFLCGCGEPNKYKYRRVYFIDFSKNFKNNIYSNRKFQSRYKYIFSIFFFMGNEQNLIYWEDLH